MLTVHEALQLPAFIQAKVVAGQNGLARQITSAYMIDRPDARYEWGRAGALLLTTGFGLKDNQPCQEAFIPKLVELGFAAVVISTEYYLPEIPRLICEAANKWSFPIIYTSWDVVLIDMLEAISDQVVNRDYTLLQKATRIHKRLTNLILQGGTLSDVAETLAKVGKRSITIEGVGGRILAEARCGRVDEELPHRVQLGYTSPKMSKRLLEIGVYQQLQTKMIPVRVEPMPDLGMSQARLVAPIMIEHQIHGYIWLISGKCALTELDEMALAHGATVAALLISKEQAVREAEEKQQSSFFEKLLNQGSTYSTIFAEQALRLGYRLDTSHQVLFIRATPVTGCPRSLANVVNEWLREQGDCALIVWRDKGLVVLIESRSDESGQRQAQKMIADLSHPTSPILIGLGCTFSHKDSNDATLQESYEQAREAAAIGERFGKEEGIMAFWELGFLHWLYHLPAKQRRQNSYMKHIKMLAAYDKQRQTSLIRTLETFLEHGGSVTESAHILYIHRNTLSHRVNRIKDLCGLDLREPLERFNLYLAVKSYRLHGISDQWAVSSE